jgi:hypothetical protein
MEFQLIDIDDLEPMVCISAEQTEQKLMNTFLSSYEHIAVDKVKELEYHCSTHNRPLSKCYFSSNQMNDCSYSPKYGKQPTKQVSIARI